MSSPLTPEATRLGADSPVLRLRLAAVVVALLGLGTSGLLATRDDARFFASYLVAFLFFLTLALGALFFVLLQWLTRAGWSVVVRRLAEHLMATLPLFALLALPLAWGLDELYPWARMTGDGPVHSASKHFFLSLPFFAFRSGVYLLTWGLAAWWFRRHSLRHDTSGDASHLRRLRGASGPVLVLFGLTVTFAAFDWIMTLDPHWYSTVFGVYVFSGAAMGALALLVVTVLALQRWGVLLGVISAEHLHDLGKLLFAFLVFWSYIAFSQFLLIWYANLPEETTWYANRLHGGWRTLTWTLALGHFVLPFLFLLARRIKRRPKTLLIAALWLLLMHYLDLYWLVMPAVSPQGPAFHFLDLTLLVGLGAIFVLAFLVLLIPGHLVPVKDPRLAESLRFENL